MKILTVIGTRPQFVKASVISREIRKHPDINNIIIHTGQHFDENMSDVFFSQLELPKPDYNLNINNCNHGEMTGRMIIEIEKIVIKEKPDLVIVYGDCNSTFAGAMVARKLNIKLAHIEAGIRSFNNTMPEEINRILTDRISDYLFCPTTIAVNNLIAEGFDEFNCNIYNLGDVMYDCMLYCSEIANKPNFDIPDKYILATVHRAENTDNPENLLQIFKAFEEISKDTKIIIPLHPRTKDKILKFGINLIKNIITCDPLGYLEMAYLLKNCSLVMTDSGGLQKEAYFNKKPCITLRNETECMELIENEVNILVGSDKDAICLAYIQYITKNYNFDKKLYGEGNAGKLIVEKLIENLK